MTDMKGFSNIQLVILLLLLLFLTQLRGSHCCHEEERAALLSFKSFITDDPGNRLSSWKGHNCCNWYGVRCSPNDSFHVVSLNLRNPNTFYASYPPTKLNGTISPGLFNLTHLKYLDLSYNDFQSSQIPLQLSNLKNLTHLDLSDSGFSGSITTQFANLSSLRYLDLSSNYPLKSSSINWVKELVKLKILRLDEVDLSVASSTKNWAQPISYLSDLKELDVSYCGISSPIPINEFLNLSRLSSLLMNFNSNMNSPIPYQLANLTSLSILGLYDCSLKGSIPHLPQLKELHTSLNPELVVNLTQMFDHHQWPKLRTLKIMSNNASGSTLASISNASSLINLHASFCSIQGSLPTSISNLSQLQELDLSGNKITGYLPSAISKLKNLKVLRLGGNNFQGPVPQSICQISSLQEIYLSSNQLNGTIPSCINKLQNLKAFDVGGNSIGGVVSLIPMINELNLTMLGLGSNRITVEIDQHSLPSKFQLQSLDLQSCNLKGYIPAFICKMTSLQQLDLSHNSLTGAIPSCFSNLRILGALDLSHNKLEVTISLPLHQHIFELDLSSNELEGPLPLPPQFVRKFDISNNKLIGGIPMSFFSKENELESLDLSRNQLSGTIPSSLKYCNSLISLNLGKNNLTGNLPDELEAKNLAFLQLSDNALNGTFPNCIQQLLNLEFLSLGNNNLGGSIPTFIGSLYHITILSLSSNKFGGSIPKEINDLHRLRILDLSRNNLSGPIPMKIGNLELLTSKPSDTSPLIHKIYIQDMQLQMVIKGTVTQFGQLHTYNSGIDLSCNILEGDIPDEIGLLKGLDMLNLSHNHLSGKLPTSMGNMISLESLDLSFNKLSGYIPQSLTSIDSLGYLNLASNNLSGEIPRGNHFDTLSVDGLSYNGNILLCGFPTNKSCEVETSLPKDEDEDEDEDEREKWLFYGVIVLGFGVGFWGLFLVLLMRKDKWWFGYWRVVDIVALRIARCMLKN